MAKKSFGHQVRDARLRSGSSQAKLAEEVGISRTYLSRIERGDALNLSWQVKTKLAETLGIFAEDESPEDLPPGLDAFAKQYDLPPDDIAMLSRLEFRGRRPRSREQWKVLYNVIKIVIVEE